MLRNNIMPRLADANISSLGYLWCTMGHNPKGHLMKFTQHTIPCRFGFELKTHVAWLRLQLSLVMSDETFPRNEENMSGNL